MMLPPTPGGVLVKRVRDQMGSFKGPDKGTTQFGERAGPAVTAGLVKDNPFPTQGCDLETASVWWVRVVPKLGLLMRSMPVLYPGGSRCSKETRKGADDSWKQEKIYRANWDFYGSETGGT